MSNSNSSISSVNFRLHLPPPSRRSSSAGPGGTSGSVSPTQACAACKYQRRKCTPDCILAPYFPADKQQQFLNAHRLFGVSNILKIIRGLDDNTRNAAMRNITFQSTMRAQDPEGGCYRIILDLQRANKAVAMTLEQYLRTLDFLRSRAPDHDQTVVPNPIPVLPQEQQQSYHHYFYGGENGSIIMGHEAEINPPSLELGQDLLHRENGEGNVDKLQMDMFEQTPLSEVVDREEDQKELSTLDFSIMGKLGITRENDNMFGQVQEHELKGAASLFKLTNSDLSGT